MTTPSITNSSLRQQLCPDELLSRVTATMRFLIMGSFPLGALVGGVLGELIGLRGTPGVSGALLTVAALPVYGALRHVRDTTDLPPGPAREVATSSLSSARGQETLTGRPWWRTPPATRQRLPRL